MIQAALRPRVPGEVARGESGQAIVELAVTMPLLILMLLGAVELGRVIYAAIEVSNAARIAAEYAAQNAATALNTNTLIQSAASADAANLSSVTTTVLAPTCSCVVNGSASPALPGTSATCTSKTCTGYIVQTVDVTTQSTFDPLIYLPGLPTTFSLYGHARQEVIQ